MACDDGGPKRELFEDLRILHRSVRGSKGLGGHSGYHRVRCEDDEEEGGGEPEQANGVLVHSRYLRGTVAAANGSTAKPVPTAAAAGAGEQRLGRRTPSSSGNRKLRDEEILIPAGGLQGDCYSVAAAASTPLWLAALLPAACAAVQFLVLYFLAFDSSTIFDDGRWLEPLSDHQSVNTTKVLSVFIALFKVSTEFGHAQKLCRFLVVGEVVGIASRMCCWWALLLQYTMAITVLFVSFSLILAGQSCANCFLKTLSVWLVIDVDNLAASFVSMWWALEFRSGPSTNLELSWFIRGWFIVIPVLVILLEAAAAVFYSTLPLTLVWHGHVSNNAAPQVLEQVLPVVAGGRTSQAKYSVLLLAPKAEPPPRLFWVGLLASPEPERPNSYQVTGGMDSDNNPALCAGNVLAEPVQAHYWLQSHGFEDSLYRSLVKRKQLYQSTMPYQASFEVQELPAELSSYKVFAAAQNPRTLALSHSVVAAETSFASACGPYCVACDDAGGGFCERCAPWSHQAGEGKCLPCPKECEQCSLTEKRCDVGGCKPGFGLSEEDRACLSCGVQHCRVCDERLGYFNHTCEECDQGYGLGANGQCHRCGHASCLCHRVGECLACVRGWGLVMNDTHTWCRECGHGCSDCDFADSARCIGCRQGFAADRKNHGECVSCVQNCQNCSKSGPALCDECTPGYGRAAGGKACSKCQVQHCVACDDLVWQCQRCKDGLGVTPDGQCEPCGHNCNRCDKGGLCEECERGYARDPQAKTGSTDCWSCADQCESCQKAGPGRCDRCRPGFQLLADARTCAEGLGDAGSHQGRLVGAVAEM